MFFKQASDKNRYAHDQASFHEPLGRKSSVGRAKEKHQAALPDALSSFFDSLQYSSGQERSEDDIRATLDDIYTTWGDIFFHTKNAINFQKFL